MATDIVARAGHWLRITWYMNGQSVPSLGLVDYWHLTFLGGKQECVASGPFLGGGGFWAVQLKLLTSVSLIALASVHI